MGEDAGTAEVTWPEAREEALRALRLALQLRLPERSWRKMAEAVKAVAEAVSVGDPELLWRAANELGSYERYRDTDTRAGAVTPAPTTPAPAQVKEPAASVVRSLEAAGADQGAKKRS